MISKFVHQKNEIVTSPLWKQSDDAGTYVMISDIYKRRGSCREEDEDEGERVKETSWLQLDSVLVSDACFCSWRLVSSLV
ncbi:hypothetical protein IGI04_015413 [Brassica rapa subsp. trilocularis]|uniref:Uncharacterized protein n=1 Tax=Brassica rapa subsp. trilocularis TaxID=1813537 RepID=A0ABQ7MSZ6_BRACM|nr:hypothetical protein IGI04_015413 [Brassica rapa subsp. trilocularis]